MESLYTKYRPQTFSDVVGQQHVVSTLERAVTEGKTSHAYLFCGPRGTGKTTMARILAKALLCQQGEGKLPDGTCEDCRLIAAGEHPDVYELDAASRTGVDNVREEIINNVGYAPVRGNRKVYIIDEVHMLTPAAFNALLKTLEEPPEHVVFIMCTTDPQKILETVLSRVQRFDFHSISNDDLLGRLRHVCEQEGFTYEDDALDIVAHHARGGMRDALSTLEQLSVFGDGTITTAIARDMLGSLSSSQLSEVTEAVAARDVPRLFQVVTDLVDSGRDLLQFTHELAAHVRDCYVLCVTHGAEGAVAETGDALARLRAEAEAFGSADRLARVLTVLGDASNEMRVATNQRLVLEIAFTRLARPESDLTLESLADRVATLESALGAIERGAIAIPAPAVTAPATTAPAQPATAAPARPAATPAPAQPVAQPAPQPAPQAAAPAAKKNLASEALTASATPAPQSAATTNAPQVSAPVRQVAAPAPAQAAAPAAQPAQAQAAPATAAAPASRPAGGTPTKDAGALQRKWKEVVEAVRAAAPSRGSLLLTSTAESDDGEQLVVSLPKGSGFALRMLERPDVRENVNPEVARVFGPRETLFIESGVAPAATAAPAAAPAAAQPARQQAVAPAAPAPAPSPASVATAPAAAPEPPAYDEPPYDPVPYDEADAAYYDDQAAPAPSTPQAAPAATPAPQPVAAPAAAAPAPRPAQPAVAERAASTTASADEPATSSFFSADVALPEEVPADLREMLAEAFPGEVRVSMIPASEPEDMEDLADEVADELADGSAGYDDMAEDASDAEYVDDADNDDSEG